MSADAITVCPACYAEALGVAFNSVTIDDLQNTGIITNQLRENHESWIDKGFAHFHFYGDCRECGYRFDVEMSAPMPEPRS